ncbi:MAG TPA: hypothetical protein VJ792_00850 [Candidatus Nitrosotalea sp.]|nr:hypothetical protein [Candidatus Nitrosotalea sp.]
MEPDDFKDIVEECSKILDESMDILSDVEFELDSAKEDIVETEMTKSKLVDMAHEVADSVRIKKAESSFVKRHFDTSSG